MYSCIFLLIYCFFFCCVFLWPKSLACVMIVCLTWYGFGLFVAYKMLDSWVKLMVMKAKNHWLIGRRVLFDVRVFSSFWMCSAILFYFNMFLYSFWASWKQKLMYDCYSLEANRCFASSLPFKDSRCSASV